MTETETTETQAVVYKMMTESTGIHMLDSGGGNGRMWQRNQMKSIEDFIAEPRIVLSDCGAIVSVFHLFSTLLEHDEEMQVVIDKVAEDNPKESWFEIRELAMRELHTADGFTFENGYNTYNHENILSQDFEGSEGVDEDSDPVLIIMLHNGADARGGYTSPYAFRYKGYGDKDEFAMAQQDYSIFCTHEEPTGHVGGQTDFDGNPAETVESCDFYVSVRGNDVCDADGNYDNDLITWEQISTATCPKCNTVGSLEPDVYWN